MPFSKFVEIGRVSFIAFGRDKGKICTIVDVIDQNRALVDGPCSGVYRHAVSFKQLHLTKFRVKFPHGASSRVVRKAWEKAKVSEAWAETSWCKKLADKKLKEKITDFDRFKLMKAKQTRNRLIRHEIRRLKSLKKMKALKAKKIAKLKRKEELKKARVPKPKKLVKKDGLAKKKLAPAKKKEGPIKKKEDPAKKKDDPAKKKDDPAKKKDAGAKKKDASAPKKDAPAQKKGDAPAQKKAAPQKGAKGEKK